MAHMITENAPTDSIFWLCQVNSYIYSGIAKFFHFVSPRKLFFGVLNTVFWLFCLSQQVRSHTIRLDRGKIAVEILQFCSEKTISDGDLKKKENSNCEILAKKNPTYLVLLVEYRSLKFAIPFRSNIQHSHAYK